MELREIVESVFDLVKGGFTLVGMALLLAAFGMTVYTLRFRLRTRDVRVRVVAHKNVRRSQNAETGRETRSYQAEFELAANEGAGVVRSLSSEIHSRNSYPVGTEWPARYDAATGKIRTTRDTDVWPIMALTFWLVGMAFVIVPNVEHGLGDNALAYILGGVGLVALISGGLTAIRERRRTERSVDVLAELADIEVARDSEGDRYDVPVLRIASGEYHGTESTDVGLATCSEADVGQKMRARFDPHTGQIDATEGRFKGPQLAPAMIGTGAIFVAIGVAMASGAL